MTIRKISKLAADNVRILSAEAIQKANSGHPGMPMGCADFAFTLWYRYMRHNPKNPSWIGRDRFVLSAGHGSMLLYSLLYFFDYGITLDDIKEFRQWSSLTPGHPEHGHTKGVEITTGPLASGFASGVGMAIAAKSFIANANLENSGLFDQQKIYILCSDGCIMEGASHEAASLAGHLKLDNIICFYDSNSITIEGATSLTFSENVGKRFEAYGWRVLHLDDANNIRKIEKIMKKAIVSNGKPTLIIGKTQIAFGSPGKMGKASSHGEPLGAEELAATKKNIGFPEEPFYISPEVINACKNKIEELMASAAKWDKKFNEFLGDHPETAHIISKLLHKPLPKNLVEELLAVVPKDKPEATRNSGGAVLQKLSEIVPALIGGSADLGPSTKTVIKNSGDFSFTNRSGKNLHFGIRELGMGFCINGLALYGTAIPYGSTFLVFADYMKPAIRLAALQKLHLVYVFTHDSVCVGEDGPTHQPIEQIAMLRSIPGLTVIRPADAIETAHAWAEAVAIRGPVALLLTRQNLDPIPDELRHNINLSKGAYVLSEEQNPDFILIATGSEVNLALGAAKILRPEGKRVRIVSMPSWELFKKQDKAYKESVIPSSFERKVSIELASTFGWERFVGSKGLCIGINHFGNSAPYKVLSEKYGFTSEQIANTIKEYLD